MIFDNFCNGGRFVANIGDDGKMNAVRFIYFDSSISVIMWGVGQNDDDRTAWNVGLDLDIGPFGLGAVYTEDNLAEFNSTQDQETLVIGADYTTGPFKLGASYYNQDNVNGVQNVELDRYTGGVTYTYGPGMSFRGSVSYAEFDDAAATPVDPENTAVLIGTDIKF